MSNIETVSFLKFFGLLGLLFIGICFAAWWIAGIYFKREQLKARQDKEFMKFYAEIQEHIRLCRVNTVNSDDIRMDLRILSKMKNANKEMVEVLACEFLRKFYEYTPTGEGKLRDDFAVNNLIKN